MFHIYNYRYVEMNVKCSDRYRKYNATIPDFLVNKPRILVAHCIERTCSAQDIKPNQVICTDNTLGQFTIKSQSQENQWYTLKFGDADTMPQCDCLDWKRWCLPCKHFLAVFHQYPNWQWQQLSIMYRESPYLSLDDELICQDTQSPSSASVASANRLAWVV